MNMIRANFRPAALRVMRITYNCDMTRAGGDVIPLGVLSELSLDDEYALCLTARSQLSEGEASRIGRLLRADLSAPFTYLLPMFNEVYDAPDPIAAFSKLEEQHRHSFSFSLDSTKEVTVPKGLTANAEARLAWARDIVLSEGDQAYWGLVELFSPDTIDKKRKDEARELGAAA